MNPVNWKGFLLPAVAALFVTSCMSSGPYEPQRPRPMTPPPQASVPLPPSGETLPSAPQRVEPPPPPPPMERVVPPSRPREQAPGPREVASLRLTEQAESFLEAGRADDAISVLERAVTLNPNNGRNYYFMAEAWLKKGNVAQARENNRLAGLYLRGDPDWMVKQLEQKGRIEAKSR